MNVADARQASTEPAVRFMDGRLLLDLAWPGMTAAAVMAVILLALAFQIGRHNPLPPRPVSSAEPPAATTAKTADPTLVLPKETRPWPAVPTHRPPDNAPVAVPTPPAARTVEAPPQPAAQAPQQPAEQANQAAYAFKPGYDYVVVQYFKLEHKDVAIDAARFLQANGVDAVVVPKKSDVEVVATTPFLLDQKDAAAKAAAQKACAALKDKIRTLGRAFAKQQAAAKKPQYAFDQPAERLEHPHTK